MDIFDQYLFEELAAQYVKPNLSSDDYEELFMRFEGLDYLNEVHPYLLTMRFFGLGTDAEKDTVISELEASLDTADFMLKGLYYDLILSLNENNPDAISNLHQMVDKGYTEVYTKEHTNIKKSISNKHSENDAIITTPEQEKADSNVVVDYITFECKNFNGLYFTAGDIDYLAAKVYIKPFHGKKRIKVCSQIFLDGNVFSEKFEDEIDISSSTRWIRTRGWGNTNCTCYRNNIYKWVVEIDGKTTFSQEFRMFNGRINQTGPRVKDVKLFASKSSGALEKDRDIYKSAFEGSTLENIYFKYFINAPGENMNIQAFIKITYMEDGTVFRDNYFLQQLDENTIAFWSGVGFSTPGQWKKGLYQYSTHVGHGPKYEGTFTIY